MRALRAMELIPPGFTVDDVEIAAEQVVVAIRAAAGSCPCPLCGAMALRVHSRYRRRVADLPLAGRRTEMVLQARRFFCDASACPRRVFAERFEGIILPRARR